MNNIQHQLAVKQAVKSSFRGKSELVCRGTPQFPKSAEREATRMMNGYMAEIHKAIKAHLPQIIAAYKKERDSSSRHDDDLDFNYEVRQEMQRIAEELEQKLEEVGIQALLTAVANMSKEASTREWKRMVRNTLGIDLLDDYYSGEFYEEIIRRWIDENVLKIKSLPNDTLNAMRDVIFEGYRNGRTIRDITKDIQESYNISKHKAQMLARDQVSSLNAAITKHQQQDAGISRYKWSTSGDSRVRDCHKALDGKIFDWDNPPEMWYMTKKSGKVMTGRRCHPGEDYLCRCVAIPYLDIDTIDVPMKEKA